MPNDEADGGRRGRVWTAADDTELRRRIDERQRVAEIAKAMQRTIDAIRGRVQVLRLTLPSPGRPWRAPVRRPPRRAPTSDDGGPQRVAPLPDGSDQPPEDR